MRIQGVKGGGEGKAIPRKHKVFGKQLFFVRDARVLIVEGLIIVHDRDLFRHSLQRTRAGTGERVGEGKVAEYMVRVRARVHRVRVRVRVEVWGLGLVLGLGFGGSKKE